MFGSLNAQFEGEMTGDWSKFAALGGERLWYQILPFACYQLRLPDHVGDDLTQRLDVRRREAAHDAQHGNRLDPSKSLG